MMSSLFPFYLVAVLTALAAVIALVVSFRVSPGRRVALSVFAFICAVPAIFLFQGLHPEFFDARYRAYRSFYNDIREGMPRAEVFALLDRHYPANGARQSPKIMRDETGALGFFMNPETSPEPNCEGIFLKIRDGVITQKTYSRD